jgi:hypothetical protein
MTTSDVDRLIERLARIEALHAGATTPGEQAAALTAMDRIRRRLREAAKSDPPVEYQFTFNNEWSKKLFTALLRRYGIEPYRYYRQRYTTVMARVPVTFVNETLWPEYTALNEALREHLEAVSESIIARAVSGDTSEPTEVHRTESLGPGVVMG